MSQESDVNTSDDKLRTESSEMFDKTKAYLRAELELTLDDYKLLREMNVVTAKKYREMNEIGTNVGKSITLMNEKYEMILPHLEQIDHLDERVSRLEEMAYAIDAYSKRLESKYKQLERK